jgi:acetyl esterase/lipase
MKKTFSLKVCLLAALLLGIAFLHSCRSAGPVTQRDKREDTRWKEAVALELPAGEIPPMQSFPFARWDDRELKLAYYPAKDVQGPSPAMVFVHGGGWSSGSRFAGMVLSQTLNAGGYTLFSVDYRLSPEANALDMVQDVTGAIRWIRANALALGVDPRRLAISGHSAGGHLAAMVALGTRLEGPLDYIGEVGGNLEQDSRVQACIIYAGVLDLVRERSRPLVEDLTHTGMNVEEAQKALSPLHLAHGQAPPILMIYGENDPLAPWETQGQPFLEAFQTLPDEPSVFIDHYIIPGASHSGAGYFDGEGLLRSLAFLKEHL